MNYLIITTLIMLIYVLIKSKKSLHMLQQNWYNDDNRYLKWIFRNMNYVFVEIDSAFIIFTTFLFIDPNIAIILGGLFYLVDIIITRNKHKNEQKKLTLVITKRIKRLILTTYILYLIPIVTILLTYNEEHITLYFLILGALIYLNYFVVMFANIINKPVEKSVFLHYRRQAIKKLKQMNNLDVIGITGSYGKTSSKNILNDILNIKLNSFATPKNFNTPYGLINSINNYLDKFSDTFIAEMGAFKKGEIKELCDLVKPKYGILTKIGTAHLESFGSQENIIEGKFELIESLPKDGLGILNYDDEYQVKYKLKNKVKIKTVAIDNKDADLVASNIKMSKNGTTFDVLFKNENKKYKFETILLGKANIYNILAALALGEHFNLTKEELQLGVKKVKVIENRLELKQLGDITLINDAYNSNPVGSKMALEVLDMMKGTKIIITPGMIELANLEYELNFKFGQYIADVCDEVILVGTKQTRPIYEGLISKKYNKKHIHILNDVKKALELVNTLKKEDTYLLIENDLPDIFNEK